MLTTISFFGSQTCVNDGGCLLMTVISSFKNLTTLNLGATGTSNKTALIFARFIKDVPSLRHLDVSKNSIKNSGAIALFKAFEGLSGNNKYLDLSDNEISQEVVVGLQIKSKEISPVSCIEWHALIYQLEVVWGGSAHALMHFCVC